MGGLYDAITMVEEVTFAALTTTAIFAVSFGLWDRVQAVFLRIHK